MSIILKGIDMPKEKDEALLFLILGDGTVAEKIGSDRYEEMTDTQAIQIPKDHGRLIDGDELKEKRETMCWKDEYYMTHESDFIDSRHIDNAPTILDKERE